MRRKSATCSEEYSRTFEVEGGVNLNQGVGVGARQEEYQTTTMTTKSIGRQKGLCT